MDEFADSIVSETHPPLHSLKADEALSELRAFSGMPARMPA
jgi:hypothetical protein